MAPVIRGADEPAVPGAGDGAGSFGHAVAGRRSARSARVPEPGLPEPGLPAGPARPRPGLPEPGLPAGPARDALRAALAERDSLLARLARQNR